MYICVLWNTSCPACIWINLFNFIFFHSKLFHYYKYNTLFVWLLYIHIRTFICSSEFVLEYFFIAPLKMKIFIFSLTASAKIAKKLELMKIYKIKLYEAHGNVHAPPTNKIRCFVISSPDCVVSQCCRCVAFLYSCWSCWCVCIQCC